MMFIGMGNVTGSIYRIAVHGIPDRILGVSRSQMRSMMLDGDLGPFWRMLDEKAPADFDQIIERIFKTGIAIEMPETGEGTWRKN